MGFYVQLEYMDKLLEEVEKMMKPVPAKERAKRGKVGKKFRRITPQMLEQQICYYESRIPT
jgi:hypothetical protein